jgi:hypothetical protein
VIILDRASLRQRTKCLIAHTRSSFVKQDNRQTNPSFDKIVQVGYHSLELILKLNVIQRASNELNPMLDGAERRLRVDPVPCGEPV